MAFSIWDNGEIEVDAFSIWVVDETDKMTHDIVQSAIFYNTPTEKWFGSRIFAPWNFWISVINLG